MNIFTRSISQAFKGAIRAFQTFPAAIACALFFALVTMVRIQLDWPQQESYNFLFNSLHWAFALGAIFSLASIAAAQSKYKESGAFKIANLSGVVVAVITFMVLYFFGGTNPISTDSSYAVVSNLSASRVSVAILISFISFIIIAGLPKEESDLSRSLFMTQKAFLIALLYGVVIMSGSSAVAGAIQALLYEGMSEKVYMYLGTITGFLAFTIFVGYFPDLRKGQIDEHRELAQKHPRFVEILFEYIMIPIVLALTVVLLIWTARTIIGGMKVPFIQLSSIATAYTIGGIWLHIMVTHYKTSLTKFYRSVYPLAALLILAFEAWALLIQLQKSGLKTTEYFFSVIWIIALVSVVLLLIVKSKAHQPIAILICFMAILSVLPGVGYHALPVTSQINHLEKLLVSEDMLKDNQLVPPDKEPERQVRQSITEAVNYLAFAENAKLPTWFDKSLSEKEVFKRKLGFEQTWPDFEQNGNGGYLSTNLILKSEAVDISNYSWVVNLQQREESVGVEINGERGSYHINWVVNQQGVATLKILLNDQVILEQSMKDYIDKIAEEYPPGHELRDVKANDMSLELDTPEVSVLIVFNNIDINIDVQRDTINYWLNPSALYIKEKL